MKPVNIEIEAIFSEAEERRTFIRRVLDLLSDHAPDEFSLQVTDVEDEEKPAYENPGDSMRPANNKPASHPRQPNMEGGYDDEDD